MLFNSFGMLNKSTFNIIHLNSSSMNCFYIMLININLYLIPYTVIHT